MKIAIYTSTAISIYDRYNITQLLNSFKNAEFLFLAVKVEKISLVNKTKQFLIQFRDGIDYFKADTQKIEQQILSDYKLFSLRNQKHELVEEVNDSKSEKLLLAFQPDFIIQSGAGILKENIFSISKIATLNVHHGYAPEIRGMNSTFWCLYYGLIDLIGVTCHVIDKNLDTGNVIQQYKYEYNKNNTFIEIQTALCYEGAKLLTNAVNHLYQHKNPEYSNETVDSYYFSRVDYRKYNKLRSNNFNAVESMSALKRSKKVKRFLII